jgi:UDPglucose 6-dehydrogenase
MKGAHVLAIVTEWNEFRALDLDKARALMRTPVLVDLRNIYRPDDVAAAGFHYASIGRADAHPSTAPRAASAGE